MDYKDMDFPQYRKLMNDKSFYCIVDGRNFVEIQIIGSKRVLHRVQAKQYPEILRIKDMIELATGYIVSSESEFEKLRAEVSE